MMIILVSTILDGDGNGAKGDYGCDVKKRDGTEYFEIKNSENTMNYDSAKSVERKLLSTLTTKHSKAYLVLINTKYEDKIGLKMDKRINIINGRRYYEILTNDKYFYDKLIKLLNYVGKHFKATP